MIDKFEGRYRFLSNFYNADVTYNDICYLNNEAAFQAQKTKDINKQKDFSKLNPSLAKRKGRNVRLREDWEKVKEKHMYEVCKAKFEQNKDLKIKLLNTDGKALVEGNTWGDYEWGVCQGRGKNKLGKILMKLRDEFNSDV